MLTSSMKNPNVLWVNPSFLDYRIPLYKELNNLYDGNFCLVYSKQRIPQRCIDKIEKTLGDNAIGLPREKQIKLGGRGDFANTGVSVPFPRGLYKLIKSVNSDVIIAEGFFQFTPWALWYSFIRRKPLIIAYERTAHTERHCPWWRKAYRKLVNKFVSGYIVNGVLTKEYLISQGVNPNKIFTGGMCADSTQLALNSSTYGKKERENLKKKLCIGNSGLIYIFVGQLIERKGVNYLLEAWREHSKRYPDDIMLIIGDGPLREAYIEKYGTDRSVIFAGAIDYSEIYKYYAISDAFVMPTLEDNWSLVVPEAMACGLPVACSIYNGCYPELVQEGRNGTLFDPLKEDTILNSLSLFHDVDLQSYGQESIKIEQEFSPKQTALNVYKAVSETIDK